MSRPQESQQAVVAKNKITVVLWFLWSVEKKEGQEGEKATTKTQQENMK